MPPATDTPPSNLYRRADRTAKQNLKYKVGALVVFLNSREQRRQKEATGECDPAGACGDLTMVDALYLATVIATTVG